MTINDLTVNFGHLDRNALLSDWAWLIGKEKLPVLITKAGDAFVQDSNTGAVCFLDTVQGQCNEVAPSGAEFQALLSDKDFVAEHFGFYLIAPMLKAGQDVPPGKLWGWIKPPVLGGECDASNLEPTDIAVHFSILGQIWNQVKDLPPGTPITDINIK